MTTFKSVGIVLAVVVVAILAVSGIALGASVSPTAHSGNSPRCDLKIEDPVSGTYSIPGQPGKTIAITVSPYQGGEQLAFVSDVPVVKVYMKGGDGYNEYDYGSAGTTADSGLVCPENRGGNVPEISHVSFCFGTVATSTTSTSATTTTSEPGDEGNGGDTTTTTSEPGDEGNGGDTTTTTSEPGDEGNGGDTTTTTSEPGDEGNGGDTTTTTSEPGDEGNGGDTTTTSDGVVGDVTDSPDPGDDGGVGGGEGPGDEVVGGGEDDVGGGQEDVTTVSVIHTGLADFAGPGVGVWALGLLALALAGGLGWSAVRPALRKK